ncbi:winged helix-turn-helix domain-containing protein [Paractinoplanes atraurantiacus]|uniref:IclR helix-turn-helix domain-containing protein n=1 Tax=Paractinoplanes atraurantiacus TaxID=1036182 RepID=A0A285IVL6_9ACTN|nr:winged helix-turn-helix domain-containing protein [Actinoplanes atraurantiacus]SNY52044.1 IclR helix-turn-helix domain-containing protein [Actinoplanes atraurantiacus]
MRKPSVSGRGWAYIGAALGGTVSIAANVAHSYVPPADASADWSPQTGAVIGAIFWPVALFVATEILARVAWPSGLRWSALRFLGLLPVALVAAIVSYKHGSGLLSYYGEDALTAHLGPLAVDGLMVMASAALLATAHRAATAEDTVPAESPAPVAAEVTTTPETPAEPIAAEAPAPVPAVKKTPAKRVTPRPASAEKVAKAAAKLPGATVSEIAAKAGVSTSTARRHLATLRVTDASPSAPVPAETPHLVAA